MNGPMFDKPGSGSPAPNPGQAKAGSWSLWTVIVRQLSVADQWSVTIKQSRTRRLPADAPDQLSRFVEQQCPRRVMRIWISTIPRPPAVASIGQVSPGVQELVFEGIWDWRLQLAVDWGGAGSDTSNPLFCGAECCVSLLLFARVTSSL